MEPTDTMFTVGGRQFLPSETTTFAQDMHVMALLEESGFTQEALSALSLAATRDDLPQFVRQLIISSYKTGNLFRLLGAIVTEPGVKWSEAAADERAMFFANVEDPEDKNRLHDALASVVLGFFVAGVKSSVTSPKSSVDPLAALDAELSAPSETPASDPAVPATSESGTTS